MRHPSLIKFVFVLFLTATTHIGTTAAVEPGYVVEVTAPVGAASVVAHDTVAIDGPVLLQIVEASGSGAITPDRALLVLAVDGGLILQSDNDVAALGAGEGHGLGDGEYRATAEGAVRWLQFRLSAVAHPGALAVTEPTSQLSGTYEIELWIVTLRPGAQATIEGSSAPMIAYAIEGTLSTFDDRSTGQGVLAAGDAGVFHGQLDLQNTGPDLTVVALAALGPLVGATSSGLSSSATTPLPAGPLPTAVTATPLPATIPADVDTDGDGLLDSQEIAVGSDPAIPDTDGDGLLDGDEVNMFGTNPIDADTDLDGLNDRAEIQDTVTSPVNSDTDLDGLNDGDEVRGGTDPNTADSDGDGFTDGTEVAFGTDPLDFRSTP